MKDKILNKINKLDAQKKELKLKNVKLLEDVQALKEDLNNKDQQLSELKSQYQTLKLAKSLEGNEVSKNTDLKLKINEMVKEIDRCIAMLNA